MTSQKQCLESLVRSLKWVGKETTASFFFQGLELGVAENGVEQHDLVPGAVRAHSGLDCGHTCLSLSFQAALKGK